jgi:SAM-dependent methyltransferase
MDSRLEELNNNHKSAQDEVERTRQRMIANTVPIPASLSPNGPQAAGDGVQKENPDAVAPEAIPFDAQDLEAIDRELEAALSAHRQVGQLSAREAGPLGGTNYLFGKVMRRSLAWYTTPLHLFEGATIRALRRIATALQAHETGLATLTTVVRQLQDQNAAMAEEIRKAHSKISEVSSKLVRRRQPPPGMLKENEKIIEYWDNAALTDPMRETVSQSSNESDDEYQQNWKKIGEYVASKIMSHSSTNPVALEIGPGLGRITVPMSRYCKSILALDISPEMADRAKETMADVNNFDVQVITDEDLSFLPSEHFDLAYSISCFQHAEKKTFYRYLEGMRRALKPGGVLFFGVLNLCSDAGWGHFAAILRNDYPEFFHTPDEIACYLQHAGYSSHKLVEEGETLWAVATR